MKKYSPINPAFTLSLVVLLLLSLKPSIQAQERKEQTIIINNGDTIINGKKLNEVSKAEHKRLLEEFKEMENNMQNSGVMFNKDKNENIVIKRKKGKNADITISQKGKEPKILYWKDLDDDKMMEFNSDDKNPGKMHAFKFNGDSTLAFDLDTLMNGFSFKMTGPDSNMHKRMMSMNKNFRFEMPEGMKGRQHPHLFVDGSEFPGFGEEERNNSQSFNYMNTDKDGITSRMNIRISEANDEMLNKITGNEKHTTSLEVADLTLFPNFSNGKITLSFNLDEHGTTDIKILDSDLKPVFTDKQINLGSNYTKQILLPKNGVYYITVSQNGNWFIRRLIKE